MTGALIAFSSDHTAIYESAGVSFSVLYSDHYSTETMLQIGILGSNAILLFLHG